MPKNIRPPPPPPPFCWTSNCVLWTEKLQKYCGTMDG